jgi:hypothetical protein
MSNDLDLKIAFRNGWILWLCAVGFIVGFFLFTLFFALDAPRHSWDMGAEKFVPAQSDYGEGYYAPVTLPEKGGAK